MRPSVCAVALVALLAAPVAAQTRTDVGVRVDIAAQRYRDAFDDSTAFVEDSLARVFARTLADRIGFVRFVPGATTPHRLVFVLDRRDRGDTGTFAEYGFWARLVRPAADSVELYWLPVRPAEMAWMGIGSMEDFLDVVSARLRDPELPAIRDQLLSRVPIATDALPWAQPAGFALPLGRDALCMRAFSEIEVINTVRVGSIDVDRADTARVLSDAFTVASPGPRERPYLRKLFGTPTSEEGRRRLEDAANSGTVRVKEVFVVKYQYDPNACERPIPPSTGGG